MITCWLRIAQASRSMDRDEDNHNPLALRGDIRAPLTDTGHLLV
jgi:hypothetical protein